MSLYDDIQRYNPVNEQEERDKEIMLKYIRNNPDYLDRTNMIGHFTTSIWTVNKDRTKTSKIWQQLRFVNWRKRLA